MAQLIPGDASILISRLLILFVWGVTPFSWFVVLTRITALYIRRTYPSVSIDTRLFKLITTNTPRCISKRLSHILSSSRWRLAGNLVYAYFCIEALFSIYYFYLCRRIQRPAPRPLYGRRFLRRVFAQALQAGLTSPSSTDGVGKGYASAVFSSLPSSQGSELVKRSNAMGLDEKSAESDVRQRLGRLRAASWVPQFVTTPINADDPRAKKFQENQAKWFFGVPPEEICRRDAMHWLAWSLFAAELEDLEAERDHSLLHSNGGNGGGGLESTTASTSTSPMPPSEATFGGPPPAFSTQGRGGRDVGAKEGEWDPTTGDRLRFLEYCLELLETRQGRSFPEHPPWQPSAQGKKTLLQPAKAGPRIRMMRLTIDPVRTASRPLVCYFVTNTLSALTIRRAIRGGFEYHTQGRLPYLYRPAPKTASTTSADKTPLIILHGLGIGLAQYSSLLTSLLRTASLSSRPLLILLQPNISQSILSPSFLHPFGHHETTSAFRHILARHNLTSIDILSHSYGSLVHSWLIKSLGSVVRRSCFVDPVCFQLWVPFVCSNFIYKRASTPIELLMRYFVAREVGTANTLCRYFDWSSNILWPNEIEGLQDGKRVRFYLAEEDAILSAKDTLEYLVESGCPKENIYYGREKAHGEMLMHGGSEFDDIVTWLAMKI
ncbi:uncharacterized protein UHOD_03431 [Ustilago sp. UG-2017b]|nr:uncharacterized protein UHOD_03431 [Ustilago sp. UG-2017b]